MVSLAGSVALWAIYFYRAEEPATAAIASSSDPGRLGLYYVFTHVTMVAGIIVAAVGDDLVIAHPFGHPEPAWIA